MTAQNNRDAAAASLKKALVHQDVVKIVAADDSIILSIAKLSVGSVLQPGDKLITAMPVNEPMVANIEVASRDVGFIRVGDPVTLKIDAFNFSEHGTAEGKVKWISRRRFLDRVTRPVSPPATYYKVGVSIDRLNFRGVPKNFRLMPGHDPCGRHQDWTSLGGPIICLDGLLRGWGEAMREP